MKKIVLDARKEDGALIRRFSVPEPLGALADFVYREQQRRFKLEHEAEEIKMMETAVLSYLKRKVGVKQLLTGVAGATGALALVPRSVYSIIDPREFYRFIARTKSFDLLQRRLNDSAVRARFEEGKRVPGIEVEEAYRLSVTRAKAGGKKEAPASTRRKER
jgi:hypothetical protein